MPGRKAGFGSWLQVQEFSKDSILTNEDWVGVTPLTLHFARGVPKSSGPPAPAQPQSDPVLVRCIGAGCVACALTSIRCVPPSVPQFQSCLRMETHDNFCPGGQSPPVRFHERSVQDLVTIERPDLIRLICKFSVCAPGMFCTAGAFSIVGEGY
jgi:hypothetical protein